MEDFLWKLIAAMGVFYGGAFYMRQLRKRSIKTEATIISLYKKQSRYIAKVEFKNESGQTQIAESHAVLAALPEMKEKNITLSKIPDGIIGKKVQILYLPDKPSQILTTDETYFERQCLRHPLRTFFLILILSVLWEIVFLAF